MGKLCSLLSLFLLNIAVVQAQTVYSGSDVQDQINAAVAAGQPTYTLPPGQINLTNSIIIPRGTRNFTLQGQSGSRLTRSIAADFPLIAIGNTGWHAFLNSAFDSWPQTSLQPVREGDVTLTTAGGAEVVPGWYCVLGTDPLNDIVRHVSGNTTYWFRRELVRVKSVVGTTVTLDAPIGRDFASAELRRVEADGADFNARGICQGITLRNLVLDGKSSADGSRASKILVCGLTNDLFVDDVSILNFNTSGLCVLMSKGISVNRARLSGGNLNSAGYGIEFAASRFLTVRNSSFTTIRTGVLFQGGSMDGLVEDCTGSTANFDISHGTGELRLTYRRVLGDSFEIANPSWRRGADRILVEDCTALREMRIYGGSSNVTIKGRYPGQANTSPTFFLFSESGGNAIPAGPSYPLSLTLEGGVSTRSDLDGVNMRQASVYGSPNYLGTLTIRNWSFRNNVASNGSNIDFSGAANSPIITVENSNFTNTYEWSSPIYLGPTSPDQAWRLSLTNNRFYTVGRTALMLGIGSLVNWSNTDNLLNQAPLTAQGVRGAEGLLPTN